MYLGRQTSDRTVHQLMVILHHNQTDIITGHHHYPHYHLIWGQIRAASNLYFMYWAKLRFSEMSILCGKGKRRVLIIISFYRILVLHREQQYWILWLESEIQRKNFEIKIWLLAGMDWCQLIISSLCIYVFCFFEYSGSGDTLSI